MRSRALDADFVAIIIGVFLRLFVNLPGRVVADEMLFEAENMKLSKRLRIGAIREIAALMPLSGVHIKTPCRR